MRPSKEKMHAEAPIFNPSFVYRQDGYELSYKIVGVFYYNSPVLSSAGFLREGSRFFVGFPLFRTGIRNRRPGHARPHTTIMLYTDSILVSQRKSMPHLLASSATSTQ